MITSRKKLCDKTKQVFGSFVWDLVQVAIATYARLLKEPRAGPLKLSSTMGVKQTTS